MALVRVYCGISSTAEGRLPFAVVDDSGRLLEYLELTDDAAGYAAVTSVLTERFGGTMVVIAVDSDDHLLVSLLAASGRPIAYTDDETADDFADRFADDESMDEVQATPDERRAVGLARALQAGALSGGVAPTPREFSALKPLLAAHTAICTGRHAAAVALREVLRELYPAALRAYPDPAEPIALAMLDALPEPSLLSAAAGKGRDAAVTVAARLVADGICDNQTALDAVTALRVAIQETPRRNGVAKQLNETVADVVRSSVAAVRSADAAATILIHSMSERVTPKGVSALAAAAPRRRMQPTPMAAVRPVSPAPVAPQPVVPMPRQPVAVPAMTLPPVVPQPVAPQQVPAQRPAWAANTPPPPTPPGFEPTPVTGIPTIVAASAPPAQAMPPAYSAPTAHPVSPAPSMPSMPAMPMSTPMPMPSMPPIPQMPVMQAPPVMPAAPAVPVQRAVPGGPVSPEPLAPFVPTLTNAVINSERAARGFTPAPAPPISRDSWPLVNEPEDDGLPAVAPVSPARITPPWQAEDLVPPPSLRLVEPEPVAAAAAPNLRLVDDSALTARIPKTPRRTERAPEPGIDDTDLLIFSSIPSAWFDRESEGESTWNSSLDDSWRAAEAASLHPSVGADTRAGLPQRVPQANLVAGNANNDRPLRIVRDAGEIAAHTSSYFRGWRRGNQEVGGYGLGGRPGRESANGWDFSREHELRDDRGEYGQRAVNYR
ncbi:hypothetical protein [Catelliglobosispora koreensis]|uniref:hypothetical protein n=1 Tax=Catelliglobosispora koreensis TaxID=129052 RepID=UPI0003763783|nr:hypothetical protein [Catelliglobosispora koreensis]